MNADELRKLAEIAGLKPKAMMGNIRYWERREADWVLWQPHLRIEQAMMVAESFPQWKVGKYKFEDLPVIYECTLTIEDEEFFEQAGSPSEAICAAALAAMEG